MEMDVLGDIRAPSWSELDLYCDRVASAVGRLSVRIFGMDVKPGQDLAHHLGRALQLTNILRDLDEDAAVGRLYLPREALSKAGIESTDPDAALASPGLDRACRELVAAARGHFDAPMRSWRRVAACGARAAHHGRGLSPDPRARRRRAALRRRARRSGSARHGLPSSDALCIDLMARTVHIIGAGLAGLAGAVRLAGQGVTTIVHEATENAGGRCRSYHDGVTGMRIDNGTHILLSGNTAALGFLKDIGASHLVTGAPSAAYPFVDLKTERALDARPRREPLLALDVRCQAPRARHPRGRLLAAASPAVAGARQDARRDHAPAPGRPMSG